jgi:voltage-gated potassium channel
VHDTLIEPNSMSARRRLYMALEPAERRVPGLSPLNRFVMIAIVLSVAVAIAESEPEVHRFSPALFNVLEIVFGALFFVEYLTRLWVASEDPRYGNGIGGRIRYAITPAAVVDLLAITPLVLSTVGAEAYVLRLLRLVRVLRLARLGRFTEATRALSHAVRSRRYELFLSVGVAFFVLLLTSTLMYLVEGANQPDAFGSIPRSMWWSIATLTTVGYGDVVPLTILGRILGGVTAITGIGLIAMPTGILAAAMSDAIQARRRTEDAEANRREGRSAKGQ